MFTKSLDEVIKDAEIDMREVIYKSVQIFTYANLIRRAQNNIKEAILKVGKTAKEMHWRLIKKT